MQSEQDPGLRQGLGNADSETAEARPRQRESEQAAALGHSSEDFAHDFGNLAMSIVSAANLLQRYSADSARIATIALMLRETGERAVETYKRLQARAREKPPGRVLFVEDDPNVRADFGKDLTAAGLKVTPAAGGEEALRRCSAGERFDLLITGLAIAEMDGLTLIARLRELDASLPAIIVSGFDIEAAQLLVEDSALDNVTLMSRSARGAEVAARAAALVVS